MWFYKIAGKSSQFVTPTTKIKLHDSEHLMFKQTAQRGATTESNFAKCPSTIRMAVCTRDYEKYYHFAASKAIFRIFC